MPVFAVRAKYPSRISIDRGYGINNGCAVAVTMYKKLTIKKISFLFMR